MRATVYLAGGESSGEHVAHATGTPENPISDAELREKFADLVEPELGADASRQFVSRVGELGGEGSPEELFEAPAASTKASG